MQEKFLQSELMFKFTWHENQTNIEIFISDNKIYQKKIPKKPKPRNLTTFKTDLGHIVLHHR